MLSWSNKAPADRPSYYAWHNQHMDGHIRLPGFQRGRRYIATGPGDRDFLVFYEVDDLDVLSSKAYTDRVNNPNALTKNTTKLIHNSVRSLAQVRLSLGVGQGGYLLTLRFDVQAGRTEEMERYLRDDALPGLATNLELVGLHLCVTDKKASGVISVERSNRVTEVPNWVVILESTTPEALTQAAGILSEQDLTRHGGAGPFAYGFYQQQLTIAKMPSWHPRTA